MSGTRTGPALRFFQKVAAHCYCNKCLMLHELSLSHT